MDKRIEHLESAPDIFVTLRPGWQYDGAHCFGEDSMAELRKTMKRVTKCDCAECRAVLDE